MLLIVISEREKMSKFESNHVLLHLRKGICSAIDKSRFKIETLETELRNSQDDIVRNTQELRLLDTRIEYCSQLYKRSFLYVLTHYYDNDVPRMLEDIDVVDEQNIVNIYHSDKAQQALSVFVQYMGTQNNISYELLRLLYNVCRTTKTVYRSIQRYIHAPPNINGNTNNVNTIQTYPLIYLMSLESVQSKLDECYSFLIAHGSDYGYTVIWSPSYPQKQKQASTVILECQRWLRILISYYHLDPTIPKDIPGVPSRMLTDYLKLLNSSRPTFKVELVPAYPPVSTTEICPNLLFII